MNEVEEQAKRLLQTLLSVPFESCALITREFRDLPLSPGLYAVKHREHGLLYIGKAKKLRERFRGGHKACTWSWLDDYNHRDIAIAFAPLSMVDVLKLGDELESILIHATQPPYNARYPSRNYLVVTMQTLPQTDRKHLSHDAALMLLAVLPERIRDAYLNYAKQIDYSIEMVLEMALADFLDPDSLTFTDCQPQIGLPLNEDRVARSGIEGRS